LATLNAVKIGSNHEATQSMTKPPRSTIIPVHHALSKEDDVFKSLFEFDAPRFSRDADGGIIYEAWGFRGVNNAELPLEPSIERDGVGVGWSALEVKVSEEFKSRAHMHMSSNLIPADELTWLALMQHYGVPTRLLDFTLSPFVGLYFALRHADKKVGCVRLWAMNLKAINDRFVRVMVRARAKERERKEKRHPSRGVSFNPDDFETERDAFRSYALSIRKLTEDGISATGTLRGELNRQGCVCAAFPSSSNPRLANQQGVFLLSCAEKLLFADSLAALMNGAVGWCKTFDIPAGLLPQLERRLFQMNVHEQSLFPDMTGLAGFVRQKMNLEWTS
jgi:FRG domain